jgi:hypothetical protein
MTRVACFPGRIRLSSGSRKGGVPTYAFRLLGFMGHNTTQTFDSRLWNMFQLTNVPLEGPNNPLLGFGHNIPASVYSARGPSLLH